MSITKHAAIDALAGRYRVVPADGPIDWVATFGRDVPRILDIGFGDGEALVADAMAHPERDVLGVEVHTPGFAALLQRLHELALANARVERADALEFLDRVPLTSLAEVRIFFPDPWPKQRHHTRRLVRADVVARLVDLLIVWGVLQVATDWPHYARQMRAVLAAEPRLGPAVDDRAGRPETKYERLGVAAGRAIVDLRAPRIT
jgi:tRNA (guanine-N7-)-methyltransferase